MSEIVKANGEIAENSISGDKPHALPEVYSLCGRDIKNVAYAVDGVTNDPDSKKWAGLLNSLSMGGHSIGAIQGAAVDSPLSTYNDRHGYSAVPTEGVTGAEMGFLKTNDVLGNITSSKTWWSKPDHVRLPISSDGEKLPLVVTTNDFSEKYYTFEEAKEVLMGVLDRIPGFELDDVDMGEDEQRDTNNQQEVASVNDPTAVPNIGSKTIERLSEAGFDVVPNEERAEKCEVKPFDFETPDEKMLELTSADVKDRYMDVKDEMDEMDNDIVRERIIQGELQDALNTIERHE